MYNSDKSKNGFRITFCLGNFYYIKQKCRDKNSNALYMGYVIILTYMFKLLQYFVFCMADYAIFIISAPDLIEILI